MNYLIWGQWIIDHYSPSIPTEGTNNTEKHNEKRYIMTRNYSHVNPIEIFHSCTCYTNKEWFLSKHKDGMKPFLQWQIKIL